LKKSNNKNKNLWILGGIKIGLDRNNKNKTFI